jgi:hypothetical protein
MGYQPNRRDKIVVWLVNHLMRLATKEYRTLISKFILYGMCVNKEVENERRNQCSDPHTES